MTSANRTRFTFCEEPTLGQTPASPRMRTTRMTGEGLKNDPKFVSSEELRADRMNADPVKINEENQGPVNFELSYPQDGTALDRFLAGTMFDDWLKTPQRDNDGIADSVITGVTGVSKTLTVAAGDAFVAGHLVRLSGFAQAVNNSVRPVVTGSATTPVLGGGAMADEAAPPGTARVKVVGFGGAAGDIQATATGLSSTALDFTTLGLRPYTFIKIGGAALVNRFATGANNAWVRVIAISAHGLECDHLPPGWLPDAGAGKQIYVWTGDLLRNGVTKRSFTFERSFLGQAVPTHIRQRGMVAGQMELNYDTEALIKGVFTFMGLSGEVDTVAPLDATPDPASTARFMSANVHVGQVTEGGSPVVGPNWVKSAKITINNNLRMITAVGSLGAVDIAEGDSLITFSLETYFGSAATLQKLLAGDVGSLFLPAIIDNQGTCFHAPRVTLTGGSPSAGGKNQDVMLPLTAQASIHPESNSQAQFERFEWVETN